MKFNIIKNNPIYKNIVANFVKIGINFFNQILLIPLYITYWGKDLYSDWIILSAVTSFFAMSDLGLNNATNNRFCIKFAQKDTKECISLLTNNYIIIIAIGILAVSCTFIFGSIIDLSNMLSLRVINNHEACCILTALVLQIFLYMASYVSDAIYNAHSLAAKATYLNNFTRLFVSISIIGGIYFNFSPLIISIISSIPILINILYKYFDTKKIFPNTFSIESIDFNLIKSVIKPSLAFMSFPIGNIVIFQGFTFIVNANFGSTTLILFNTSRTLVNFIRTLIQTLTSAIKPEFSLAYGRNDIIFMKRIYRKLLITSITLSCIIALFISLTGPFIYKIWLSNEIPYNNNVIIPLLIAMIFNAIWEACGATLTSTNNHIGMGIMFVISTLTALLSGFILINTLGRNIFWIAISLCISDILMSYFTFRKSQQLF